VITPVKNLLVYADGRIEDAGQELLGRQFIQMENVDGDWWQRTFTIHCASDGRGVVPKVYSLVGIETEFRLTRTRAQVAKDDEERRAKVMRECLWGIANYPGDDAE
jgi:hypothetical protein